MSGERIATVNASRPRVHKVRELTESTYVLRFDRNGMEFEPGQYVSVGVAGEIDMREYSIYSSPDQDFLEILVKEVEGGLVSRRLRRLGEGDRVELAGPFGFFVIDRSDRNPGDRDRSDRNPGDPDRPFLFIATGTGVSPFHCFALSYPELDYRLLHGVRHRKELYEHEVFQPERVVRCISREDGGDFHGRVTDYLRQHPVAPETLCYLCGNCDMIYESFDILKSFGVEPEQLFAEVYF